MGFSFYFFLPKSLKKRGSIFRFKRLFKVRPIVYTFENKSDVTIRELNRYFYEIYEKEEVNMDEMKLKLSTKFMRGMVSKLISKAVYKKLGYKVDIQLNDINVEFIDGETSIHADVDLRLDKEEFTKLIKSTNSE